MSDLPVTTKSPSTKPPQEEGHQSPYIDPNNLTFWQRWGELFLAAGVLLVAATVLIETQEISVRQGVVVSPRIFPQIVGIGLLICGIWYAIDIIRAPNLDLGGEDDEDVDPNAPTDWSVLGIIAVALIAYAILMEPAGFVIASAILFMISAFAMGSRKPLRDIPVAVALGLGIFMLFDGWLGVRLPDGLLEGMF